MEVVGPGVCQCRQLWLGLMMASATAALIRLTFPRKWTDSSGSWENTPRRTLCSFGFCLQMAPRCKGRSVAPFEMSPLWVMTQVLGHWLPWFWGLEGKVRREGWICGSGNSVTGKLPAVSAGLCSFLFLSFIVYENLSLLAISFCLGC